jgi:hypothetical protein
VQPVGDRRDARTIDDRDDRLITTHQIVEPYELRRALDRIELALRRPIGLIVLRVLPPSDVSALPLIVLGRNFL